MFMVSADAPKPQTLNPIPSPCMATRLRRVKGNPGSKDQGEGFVV